MIKRGNILITGSSGFLGRILSKALSSMDYNVLDLKDKSNNKIDIRHPFSLDEAINIDIVVHVAGKAHSYPRSHQEKEDFFAINLNGTKNLCSAISSLGKKPKAFIFMSTVAVYGLDCSTNINEESCLMGYSPYAKSKILAEEYLTSWAEGAGITLAVLRLPLLVGPTPPGNLGAMINGIKSGRYLSIGNANAKKSVVWAEDIADIVPVLSNLGGIYNLTDGDHPSFGDLEEAISISLGKSKPIKISTFIANIIGRIGDLMGENAPINSVKLRKITSTLTFDDSKARKVLGWNPTKVLDKIHEIVG